MIRIHCTVNKRSRSLQHIQTQFRSFIVQSTVTSSQLRPVRRPSEGDQLLTTSASFPTLRAQKPSRADDTVDQNSLFHLPTVHNTSAIFSAHSPNLNAKDNILLPPPPLLSERSSLTVLGSSDLNLGPVKESQLALSVSNYAEPASEWTPRQLGETRKKKRSKLFWVGAGLEVALVLFSAVFLPVFFGVIRKLGSKSAAASSSSSSSGGGGGTTGGTDGHGGSTNNAIVSADKRGRMMMLMIKKMFTDRWRWVDHDDGQWNYIYLPEFIWQVLCVVLFPLFPLL